MFNTSIIRELYTCYTKKDELIEKRKEQMNNYQEMIGDILNKPCTKNIIEFYKLFEAYNYNYNLETLENPLKCDKLEELIIRKNTIINHMKSIDICNDFDKVKDLFIDISSK